MPSSRPPLLKRLHSNSHRFVESISPSTEREATVPRSQNFTGNKHHYCYYDLWNILFIPLLYDALFFSSGTISSLLVFFHADFKATHVFIDRAKHICAQRQYQLPLHLQYVSLCLSEYLIYIYSISMESMMCLHITKSKIKTMI